LLVDDADRQSPGMISFHRVRQLKQFAFGGLGDASGRSSLNFIVAA
jgi:hypothetical protein